MVLSLVAPLANTALVAPTSGGVDCGLTVSQSGVAAGTTVQLTWWTVNAQNGGVTMSDNGSTPVAVNPSGSIPLTINANHSFALTVRNTYGSKTCTASITSSTQTNNGPTCAISVPPGTYYAGQAVPLIWYSHNATSGQVGGIGAVSGSRLESGSGTIYPQQSTAVSMGVANQYGSNSCSTQVVITPRPTTTAQQPSYTTTSMPTTSYRPITYPSWGSSPTYNTNPYSSNSRYPSPLYSSGWYPNPTVWNGTNRSSDAYWDPYGGISDRSLSSSNGLGDYTLTNMWNNAYSGETLISNHDCSGLYCDSQPYSWGYASNWQADGTYGPTTYRIGGDGAYGYQQFTFDGNGNVVGYNREIPNSVFENTPSDGTGGWYGDGNTSRVSGASPVYTANAVDPSSGQIDIPPVANEFPAGSFGNASVQSSGEVLYYSPESSTDYWSGAWSNATVQTNMDASMSDGLSTGNSEVWNVNYDSSLYQGSSLDFRNYELAVPVYQQDVPSGGWDGSI
jgi:hypothetical protein